jgi:hypothetical protein
MNLAPAAERAAGVGKAWTTVALEPGRCQPSSRGGETQGLTEPLLILLEYKQKIEARKRWAAGEKEVEWLIGSWMG